MGLRTEGRMLGMPFVLAVNFGRPNVAHFPIVEDETIRREPMQQYVDGGRIAIVYEPDGRAC
jgi:hypothetical protein